MYNALQTSYKQQVANPFRGVSAVDLTVAYTLSRFVGDGGSDQNFSATAFDNNNPGYFTGPTSLDRTHQFKFGLTFDVAHKGPRFSVIGNFASAPPTTLLFTSASSQPETVTGEIYRTDLTGDGSVSDLFPVNSSQSAGKPGQFMRSLNKNNLTQSINSWNSTQAANSHPGWPGVGWGRVLHDRATADAGRSEAVRRPAAPRCNGQPSIPRSQRGPFLADQGYGKVYCGAVDRRGQCVGHERTTAGWLDPSTTR